MGGPASRRRRRKTSLFHAGGELASSLLGMTPFVREAPQPQREQLEAEDELAVTQRVETLRMAATYLAVLRAGRQPLSR